MNKIFRNLALTVAVFSATAVGAQTYYGYADESTCSYRTGKRFNAGVEQGFAIKISKEKAALLKGKKITGLRALFSTGSNAENIKMFVAKNLGEANSYEQSVSAIKPRFTNYDFSSPYTITDDSDLYIGFTLDYTSNVTNVFSVDWTAELSEGLVWAYTSEGWKSVACDGAPAIYLILDNAINYTDVMVKPVSLGAFYTSGKSTDFNGQLFNAGSEVIKSMDLSFKLGDNDAVTRHIDGLNIEPRTVYDFVLNDCMIENSGRLPLTIEATNINNAQDADPTDNIATSTKYIYPENVRKRTMLEVFTGMECPNCPAGSAVIGQAVEGREDDFVIVAHHTFGGNYGQDKFSMTEDDQYKWFFNGPQYAPGVMANRVPYVEGLSNPVVQGNVSGDVQSVIDAAENRPPYVDVNMTTTYDEQTKVVTVDVYVTTYEIPPYENNRLNLFLKQNNIKSLPYYPQQGAGSNYIHNYVFRGSLTGVWGEEIELKEGETVKRTYTYTLPDAIVSTYSIPADEAVKVVLDDMYVTAFVEGVTTLQVDCPIYNSVEVALKGGSTVSVENVASDDLLYVRGNTVFCSDSESSVSAYNMQGVEVAAAQHELVLNQGMYLVRAVTSDGNIVIRKIIIR